VKLVINGRLPERFSEFPFVIFRRVREWKCSIRNRLWASVPRLIIRESVLRAKNGMVMVKGCGFDAWKIS
jgi:hypothetical protein